MTNISVEGRSFLMVGLVKGWPSDKYMVGDKSFLMVGLAREWTSDIYLVGADRS